MMKNSAPNHFQNYIFKKRSNFLGAHPPSDTPLCWASATAIFDFLNLAPTLKIVPPRMPLPPYLHHTGLIFDEGYNPSTLTYYMDIDMHCLLKLVVCAHLGAQHILRGYCTPGQFLDCFCIFLKNYNILVTSKICFL